MVLTRNRKIGIGVGVVALAIALWLAFAYFGVHKLWVDDKVDEDLTEFTTEETTDVPTTAPPATTAGDAPATTAAGDSAPTAPAAVLVASGAFVGVEGHTVNGEVNLIRRPDGRLIVQFPDLDAENGPDLVVWLSQGGDTSEVIDLGGLKGNIGNQEYLLPEGVGAGQFDTVLIWCRRFSVGFGEAALS